MQPVTRKNPRTWLRGDLGLILWLVQILCSHLEKTKFCSQRRAAIPGAQIGLAQFLHRIERVGYNKGKATCALFCRERPMCRSVLCFASILRNDTRVVPYGLLYAMYKLSNHPCVFLISSSRRHSASAALSCAALQFFPVPVTVSPSAVQLTVNRCAFPGIGSSERVL